MTVPLDQADRESPQLPDHDPAGSASPAVAVDKIPGELGALLTSLVQANAHRYQPVRFHYISTLARRAGEQQAPVAGILEKKAAAALEAYQEALSHARQETAVLVSEAAGQFPEYAEHLQQLFDSCDFRAVGRLAARLRGSATRELLTSLTGQISNGSSAAEENHQDSSFDDILRLQEIETLNSAAAKTSPGPARAEAQPPRELNAVRQFRESLVKVNADRLIRQAIDAVPDDSGPLNPQMLVIRTLATMGELSPRYLRRLVSYLDTLLWLEQADESGEPASARKPGTRSAAKRTGRDDPGK